MTALNQFQRLESSGIWRETPQARLRDVIVSFGDATLVLTDPRSETPLAHWSLAAVTRLNPGKHPAVYAPGGAESDEELEIEDELMISAIARIHRAIEARKPHPGRLRSGMMLSAAIAMAIVGVFWVPPALVRHAASVAPPAQRHEIGRTILSEMSKTTGAACSRPAGDVVRKALAERLITPGAEIFILPTTLRDARTLPGNITIIGEDLIAGQQSPEAAAGHILAAVAAATANDPMLDALRYAGPRATFHLMTTGKLPENALQGYGERLLSTAAPRPEDEPLLKRFAEAGVSSEPYARSLDPTGEAVLGLIEADPFRTEIPRPVLSDRDWLALQEICDQ